jgi:hypothetical protein
MQSATVKLSDEELEGAAGKLVGLHNFRLACNLLV